MKNIFYFELKGMERINFNKEGIIKIDIKHDNKTEKRLKARGVLKMNISYNGLHHGGVGAAHS